MAATLEVATHRGKACAPGVGGRQALAGAVFEGLGVEPPEDVDGVAGFDDELLEPSEPELLLESELDEDDDSEELPEESVLVLAAVEVEVPPLLSFL